MNLSDSARQAYVQGNFAFFFFSAKDAIDYFSSFSHSTSEGKIVIARHKDDITEEERSEHSTMEDK